jgi:uncharacterized protein YsxB (DUF464 family)
MVTVTFDPAGRLTVTGHAGQGPPGADVVCAAVSALVETLGLGWTRVVPGDGVRCRIAPGAAEFVWEALDPRQEAVLHTIVEGFRDLAGSHGRYVRVVERDGSR